MGTWFASLPRIHLAHVGVLDAVGLITSTVCIIVGASLLWSTKWIGRDMGGFRNALFDTTLYSIYVILFGLSAFLCDLVFVLTSIVFFITWVSATQFSLMFLVQNGI